MGRAELNRVDEVFVIDFGDDENVTDRAWVGHLRELLDEVEAADGPKGLVTTGSGRHYSNGLDVGFMSTASEEEVSEYVGGVLQVVRRLMLLPMPTAAAVNGHAFGIGAFLVLAHDQAVMRSDRGYFCLPEVHLSMPIPAPLMDILRAALPPRTLRQATATGHRYGGPEATAAGIVDAVSELDDLLERSVARVASLASTSGPNLGGMKRDLFPDVAARFDQG